MPATETEPRRSEARDRLLRVASGIFYSRGIHSVGIEQIVETAEVTRATLYRHFRSKDELVVAYLEAASRAQQDQFESAVSDDQRPEDAVRAAASVVADGIKNPVFRGCAFLNAATEYPDEAHPVHRAVLAHRQWFHDYVVSLFQRLDGDSARGMAELFVLLRDGAMAAGCLSDPDEVVTTFRAGVDNILASLD